ncbi:MAG TPA: HAMP domain-containing protein, partial [Bdellovibrionota bacterium]|nr:HAMP domain-containing protein [Bdellovibrionota bacterium]
MKGALVAGVLAIVFVSALAVHKQRTLESVAQDKLALLADRHSTFRNLFQASFYFYFKDQFLPGVQKHMSETAGLERVQVLTRSGGILFDSVSPAKFEPDPNSPDSHQTRYGEKQILEHLSAENPSVFVQGFKVRILMPAGPYAILYTFGTGRLRDHLAAWLALGVLAALFLGMGMHYLRRLGPVSGLGQAFRRLWGLRLKFLVTILAVNGITGAIVYVTLSEYQARDLAERIEKESLLFSQFSSDRIVQDFSNYFYFYYRDRFLPAVKSILATDENLVLVRIISNRTRAVLFDSEQESSGSTPAPSAAREQLSEEEEALLMSRGVITRTQDHAGRKQLLVTRVYRNENGEPLFLVDFGFNYLSLERSVSSIRRRILLDLMPSMAIGLLIGMLFAQLVISPLRRLVAALRRVTEGDYESTLHIRRSDELGELAQAFNAMTSELRKKQELKKYLSDTTYRQIMAHQGAEGDARIGGKRVAATVLFSDIR